MDFAQISTLQNFDTPHQFYMLCLQTFLVLNDRNF